MRIPALGGRGQRLAQLAVAATTALIVAACSSETSTENATPPPGLTGDEAAPGLFGETANGIGFPHEVVTTEGIASAGLYLPIFLIAVVIFVLIEGLLLFMAIRFRKKGKDGELPAQTHGNNALEIVWTVIPMAVVAILFVISTMVLIDIESQSDEHAAVVDVEAFQFGWTFKYMDPDTRDEETGEYEPLDITIVGGGRDGAPEMVLPVGEPVLFRLTSAEGGVIHSFYVPAFFFKRDAIPGRVNEFEVTIEQANVYGGQCAEFCGLAHGDMFFSVRALPAADYDAWVAEQTGGTVTAEADEPAVDEAEGEAVGSETTDTETTDETSEEAA